MKFKQAFIDPQKNGCYMSQNADNFDLVINHPR